VATQQKRKSQRSSRRGPSQPRYVEPVLDPTWVSAYSPSLAERDENVRAIKKHVVRSQRPALVVAGSLVILGPVLSVVGIAWYVTLVCVVAGLGLAVNVLRVIGQLSKESGAVASDIVSTMEPGGTPVQRQRLLTIVDRLNATFGLNDVSCFVVKEPVYNAALVPNGRGVSLFVTSGLMNDFELIELEGVVAHLFARQRLAQMPRRVAAVNVTGSARRAADLAGAGTTYRADEIAAAAIRYPNGLASALARMANQSVPKDSYFAHADYARNRWVWCNVMTGLSGETIDDLDNPSVRSRALLEW